MLSLISSYFQNFKDNMCLKNALYSFKIYFLNVLVENMELERTSPQNLFFFILKHVFQRVIGENIMTPPPPVDILNWNTVFNLV